MERFTDCRETSLPHAPESPRRGPPTRFSDSRVRSDSVAVLKKIMKRRLSGSLVVATAVSIGLLRPTVLEATPSATHERQEIVFVDETVEGYRALLTGINTSVETVLLDGRRDGLEQIAQELSGRGVFDAVHLISHGRQAELQLGRATLTRDSLVSEYADELGVIRRSLAEGADVLIMVVTLERVFPGGKPRPLLRSSQGRMSQRPTISPAPSRGVATGSLKSSLGASRPAWW